MARFECHHPLVQRGIQYPQHVDTLSAVPQREHTAYELVLCQRSAPKIRRFLIRKGFAGQIKWGSSSAEFWKELPRVSCWVKMTATPRSACDVPVIVQGYEVVEGIQEQGWGENCPAKASSGKLFCCRECPTHRFPK